MRDDKQFLLIVLPDKEIRKIMLDAIQEYGCPFSYEVVTAVDEARKRLAQKTIHAIVMTKSAALYGDDGTNGIVTSQVDLPATITILQKGDGYPEYLYSQNAIHDWITTPFDLQEFYNRIKTAIRRTNQ